AALSRRRDAAPHERRAPRRCAVDRKEDDIVARPGVATVTQGRRLMLAAKHLDPIMGIDVHIVQAPGPVPPAPIPHPYIGMVLDVMDYLPKIGATVKVNGLPRGKG